MEDWIASHLDLGEVCAARTSSPWTKIIENLPARSASPKTRPAFSRPPRRSTLGSAFKLRAERGDGGAAAGEVACQGSSDSRARPRLTRLDRGGQPSGCSEFPGDRATGELDGLCGGRSPQAVRRWATAARLKICGLPPQLARVFPIAGVDLCVPIYSDEAAAIESPWPASSGPRPLPVEILSALTRAADDLPIRGGATEAADLDPLASIEDDSFLDGSSLPAVAAECEVWLHVQIGSARGRSIAIYGPKFVIGRDRSCHLRLGSAMVSKFHAAIELRDRQIFVRDSGSTNGTLVDGRIIRDAEVEIHDGCRIQVGLVVCTLAVGPDKSPAGPVEKMIAGWLQGEGSVPHPYHGESQATISFPTTTDEESGAAADDRIKHEVIQDVLVITPRLGELDDPEAIELLRSCFHSLFEQPMPRQVVLSLEFVHHLNAQAIGVILAHHFRLDRAGGSLRLCQTPARVMAVLHQVRLTMLVECRPTLDEAVLSAWPGSPG